MLKLGSLRSSKTHKILDGGLRGFPVSSNSNGLTTHALVILLQNGVRINGAAGTDRADGR